MKLNRRLGKTRMEEEHVPASSLLIAVGHKRLRQAFPIGDRQPYKLVDPRRIETCRGVGRPCSAIVTDDIGLFDAQGFDEGEDVLPNGSSR
ncbi:hypothetical protein ACQ3JU_0125 (plasmid) [Bradyrhizobium guangxiense]